VETVILLLGGTAAAWPLAAQAQQASKLPTIGFLGANPSVESQWVAAFVQRLRELGWIDDRNMAIEYRWAEGRGEHYAESAAEFVRLKVDIIVTVATPPTVAAKQAKNQVSETGGKKLELLREVVPGLHRLAILANVSNPACCWI
jgi:putative ABC transport system substrate-binding protein